MIKLALAFACHYFYMFFRGDSTIVCAYVCVCVCVSVCVCKSIHLEPFFCLQHLSCQGADQRHCVEGMLLSAKFLYRHFKMKQ